MIVNQSRVLEVTHTLLTMPDLINYWLCGQKVCEFSIATTTQCFDPRQRMWANPLLERMHIPTRIFPELVEPGTVLGNTTPWVAEETGATCAVIAPASHDTGSAVAAVPAQGQNFAWISSGTWSIMGTELREPVINQASLNFNFTNEGGVNGTFRFSKNIAGLWLVQESRRTWAAEGGNLSYSDLTEMASQADPLVSVIDPDCLDFIKPGDMPARIRAFCQRTGQPVPNSKGAIIRCVLEGLALKYRWVLERLEEIVGRPLAPIHIVGGGAQNRLLNQFTADATERLVVAGPVEATAIGNILMQALALGQLNSLEGARAVVRRSFVPDVFEPVRQADWDDAYERLLQVMNGV
jgi:rhamnulokinase